MHWQTPKPGEFRIVKKFAWLPKKLDSPLNVKVWLESYFEEQYWDHYDVWNKVMRWQGEKPKLHPKMIGRLNSVPEVDKTPDEAARHEIKSMLGVPETDKDNPSIF